MERFEALLGGGEMKAQIHNDPAREKKYLTLEMTPDELMVSKSPEFVWKAVIDKASD